MAMSLFQPPKGKKCIKKLLLSVVVLVVDMHAALKNKHAWYKMIGTLLTTKYWADSASDWFS